MHEKQDMLFSPSSHQPEVMTTAGIIIIFIRFMAIIISNIIVTLIDISSILSTMTMLYVSP